MTSVFTSPNRNDTGHKFWFFSLENVIYAKISSCFEKGLMLQNTEQVFCNADLFIISHSHKYTQNLGTLKGFCLLCQSAATAETNSTRERGVTMPLSLNSVPWRKLVLGR